MTAVSIDAAELVEVVERLRFVAELCAAQPEELNVALCRFTATYYPAHHFALDVMVLADRLARAMALESTS